ASVGERTSRSVKLASWHLVGLPSAEVRGGFDRNLDRPIGVGNGRGRLMDRVLACAVPVQLEKRPCCRSSASEFVHGIDLVAKLAGEYPTLRVRLMGVD